MTLSIRKASVGEEAAVLSFYENLIDEMRGSPYPLRWTKGVYPAGDDIADAIRAGTLYVAEDGGGIIGAFIIKIEIITLFFIIPRFSFHNADKSHSESSCQDTFRNADSYSTKGENQRRQEA